MKFKPRKGFTLLEIIVAATILAAVVTGVVSVVPDVVETLRREANTSTYVQDGRNIGEVLMAQGLENIISVCNGRNPCTSANSNINTLLPPLQSDLNSNDVFVRVDFYDGNGNSVSDLSRATIGEVLIQMNRPNNQETLTFQTSIAASYGPESAYGVTVRGNARRAQAPFNNLPDTLITMVSKDAVAQQHSDNTDGSGNYRITGVQPAYYDIRAKKDYYYESLKENVLIKDNPTVIDFALDEKPFNEIINEGFDNTSRLVTPLVGTEVSGGMAKLAIYSQLVSDNPQFASVDAESNVQRYGGVLMLAETIQTYAPGAIILGSDMGARYFTWSGCTAPGRDSGYQNAHSITYTNSRYIEGTLEIQWGDDNSFNLFCGGWGNFDGYYRFLRDGEVLSGSGRVWASGTSSGYRGYDQYHIAIPQGTHTYSSQGRTRIKGASPAGVGTKLRYFQLFGTRRYEFASYGYAEKRYKLPFPTDRVKLNWDASTPPGTSLVMSIKTEGGSYQTVPKDDWYWFPYPVDTIWVRADLYGTWDQSPSLSNYWLFVPAYYNPGYVETISYMPPPPDGSDTDQVRLYVNQITQAGQPYLDAIFSVNGTNYVRDTNVITDVLNDITLTLKQTGPVTLYINPIYTYNDRLDTVYQGCQTPNVKHIYINHPQTIYVDYYIEGHASVFTRGTAVVRLYNPSGQLRISKSISGLPAFPFPKTRSAGATDVPVSVSPSEVGTWTMEAYVYGSSSCNRSVARMTVDWKDQVFNGWDISVSDNSKLEVALSGSNPPPGTYNIYINQLQQNFIPATSVDYHVSSDGGLTWYPIQPGVITNVPPGGAYRVRATLYGHDAATPYVDHIWLEGRSP